MKRPIPAPPSAPDIYHISTFPHSLGGKRPFNCYPSVMELTLGSWRQQGRVSLWRYQKAPRMYAGWHFAADKDGCASLLSLCDLLSIATTPAHRTLAITNPIAVGVDRIFGDHDLRLDIPAKLRVANDLDGASLFGLSADVFVLPLGTEDISHFTKAIKDISDNYADFGVGFGNSDTIVNFWWWPKKR